MNNGRQLFNTMRIMLRLDKKLLTDALPVFEQDSNKATKVLRESFLNLFENRMGLESDKNSTSFIEF